MLRIITYLTSRLLDTEDFIIGMEINIASQHSVYYIGSCKIFAPICYKTNDLVTEY